MHSGTEVLGGPVWWYFVAVYLLAVALAVFALFDSQRAARRERLAQLPEPTWLYPVVSGLYLIFVVGVWLPFIPRVVSVAPVAMTPIAIVVGVAYLLRVVFPKAKLP